MTNTEILNWLSIYDNCYNEKNYDFEKIDNKFIINSYTDVNISGQKIEKLPFKFGTIDGSFDCSFNKLISFKNAPEYVLHDFLGVCNNCDDITFLPIHVGNNIDISFNPISSIKTLLSTFGGHLIHNIKHKTIEDVKHLYKPNPEKKSQELKLSVEELEESLTSNMFLRQPIIGFY